jgi:hypothetical protein
MAYLRARDNTPHAESFWFDVRYDVDLDRPVPRLVRELANGERRVECDRDEALAALAWAHEQDAWPAHLPDDLAPVYMREMTSA